MEFLSFLIAISFVKVLVTNQGGKTKVHVATDTSAPLTLHWGLSKGSGEWIVS